jgi:hypothetical protein
MQIGSLVRHHATTGNNVCGLGIIVKVHEMLDYNGHTRVDVHWANLGTRTEIRIILREVTCE